MHRDTLQSFLGSVEVRFKSFDKTKRYFTAIKTTLNHKIFQRLYFAILRHPFCFIETPLSLNNTLASTNTKKNLSSSVSSASTTRNAKQLGNNTSYSTFNSPLLSSSSILNINNANNNRKTSSSSSASVNKNTMSSSMQGKNSYTSETGCNGSLLDRQQHNFPSKSSLDTPSSSSSKTQQRQQPECRCKYNRLSISTTLNLELFFISTTFYLEYNIFFSRLVLISNQFLVSLFVQAFKYFSLGFFF